MKWLDDHRLGVWAFLVAVTFIPGILSSAYVGRWAVIAIGVPLCGLIAFNFKPEIKVALAMGILWAALSILWIPDRPSGLLELYFMIVLVGVMGITSQQESIEDMMAGMCLGVGVSSVLCILLMFGIKTVAQGSGNYAGLFYNSEVLTEFAAPLFVWAVVSGKWRWIAATIVPMLANGSRISVIAAGIGIAYAARVLPRRYVLPIVMVVVAAIVTMAAYRFNGTLGSFGQRLVVWLAAIMALTPMGSGLGWYKATHPFEEFVHSDAIQMFLELGVGAVFFAIIPLYVFWGNRGSNAERAAFVAICVEIVLSFPLHVPASAFLAAVLAGYLVSDSDGIRVVQSKRGIHRGEDHRPLAQTTGGYGSGRRFGGADFPLRPSAALVSTLGAYEHRG